MVCICLFVGVSCGINDKHNVICRNKYETCIKELGGGARSPKEEKDNRLFWMKVGTGREGLNWEREGRGKLWS